MGHQRHGGSLGPDSDGDSDIRGDSYGDSDTPGRTDSHAVTDTDGRADGNGFTHAWTDSHAWTDGYGFTDTGGNADGSTYADGGAHTPAGPDGNGHCVYTAQGTHRSPVQPRAPAGAGCEEDRQGRGSGRRMCVPCQWADHVRR